MCNKTEGEDLVGQGRERIANTTLTTQRRVRALNAQVFAKAPYGVEATQKPDALVNMLKTATLDAASRFRTRLSPAPAYTPRTISAKYVKADILKRRLRYFASRFDEQPGTRKQVVEVMCGITEYDVENPTGPVATPRNTEQFPGGDLRGRRDCHVTC